MEKENKKMKNASKILALLMALCMVLSLSVTAFASDEPSAEPSSEAKSVEEAFIDYIYEWLLDELEINGLMTEDIIENEYMPLVRAFDFVSFPAEMLYNGMLEQGCPMTFEEFAAQYVPEDEASAEPSGEASDDAVWDAYVEYLHDYLVNVELPVNTNGLTMEIIENSNPIKRGFDLREKPFCDGGGDIVMPHVSYSKIPSSLGLS
jgi:hypothetical protein